MYQTSHTNESHNCLCVNNRSGTTIKSHVSNLIKHHSERNWFDY